MIETIVILGKLAILSLVLVYGMWYLGSVIDKIFAFIFRQKGREL